MKAVFTLNVITPEKNIWERNVESLVVPRKDGYFGILANHALLTSSVSAGIMKLSREGEKKYFVVGNGVLEVRNNRVLILCDAVFETDNIVDAFDLLEVYMQKNINPSLTAEKTLVV